MWLMQVIFKSNRRLSLTVFVLTSMSQAPLPAVNKRGGQTSEGRDDQSPWRIISYRAAPASNHTPLPAVKKRGRPTSEGQNDQSPIWIMSFKAAQASKLIFTDVSSWYLICIHMSNAFLPFGLRPLSGSGDLPPPWNLKPAGLERPSNIGKLRRYKFFLQIFFLLNFFLKWFFEIFPDFYLGLGLTGELWLNRVVLILRN